MLEGRPREHTAYMQSGVSYDIAPQEEKAAQILCLLGGAGVRPYSSRRSELSVFCCGVHCAVLAAMCANA